ncbi:hypothetical protein N7519_009116 [Penicillium mononematosum]|uniref:uncharacterized protein n=1 Tax=Penicillium mononematosum TaxID=268346 RepID=UPI0025493DD8|nr:uncharacterized protein N7519_009116 [Penicillium mononematosum]KAJ6178655.1 hypothetical protein N7519_009116 [Penicillium mononematosum]
MEPPAYGSVARTWDAERATLIDTLRKNAKKNEADSTYWACLWLSDIECLRGIVRGAEYTNNSAACMMTSKGAFTMIKTWQTRSRVFAVPLEMQKKRKFGEDENQKQKLTAKTACLERDDFGCVITNCPEVDVAHIYPLCLKKGRSSAKNETYDNFWESLGMFWSEDLVAKWESRLTGPGGTELCENLLCLCPNAHRYWGACYFALQPLHLRDDGKELITRFYWLPKITPHRVQVQDKPSISLHPHEKFLNLWVEGADGSAQKMNSGDLVVFQTKDPENMPLPSWDLLKMQWVLNRIGAISGAASASTRPWDWDTEDEDANMEFEYSDDESIDGLPLKQRATILT